MLIRAGNNNFLIKEDELSSFKKKVLAELQNYLRNLSTNPLRLFNTDQSRADSVKKILDSLSAHDLIFLATTLEETVKIENRNSQLRDRVGKEALSQLYKYTAGAVELIQILWLLKSLANTNALSN